APRTAPRMPTSRCAIGRGGSWPAGPWPPAAAPCPRPPPCQFTSSTCLFDLLLADGRIRDVPRPRQRHPLAPESRADDGEHDKGGEEEGVHRDHALPHVRLPAPFDDHPQGEGNERHKNDGHEDL